MSQCLKIFHLDLDQIEIAIIYLHFVLDEWFEKIVKKESKGFAGMVRYADDSVACFEHKEEAEKYLRSVKTRLGMFGLEISEEKTKIIEFGRYANQNRRNRGEKKPETFDFLGFTHYCSQGKEGKFRVKRKTSRKKKQAKLKEMKIWLRTRMQENVTETVKLLNVKLQGYYRYYGITDNTNAIREFYEKILWQLYKMLNRRSQKRSYNWQEYYQKIGKRINKPQIYVDIVRMSYVM